MDFKNESRGIIRLAKEFNHNTFAVFHRLLELPQSNGELEYYLQMETNPVQLSKALTTLQAYNLIVEVYVGNADVKFRFFVTDKGKEWVPFIEMLITFSKKLN